MSYVGADVESLQRAAAQLRASADELDGHNQMLTSMLGGIDWAGDVATRFLSTWTGAHRVNLTSTSHFFREAAGTLDRNAREQAEASTSAGGAVGGGAQGPRSGLSGGPPYAPWLLSDRARPPFPGFGQWTPIDGSDGWLSSLGDSLRTIGDGVAPFGGFLSVLDSVKDVPLAGAAGKTIGAFGNLTTGYTIAEDLFGQRYVDAGLETAFLGGDVAADFAKTKGHVGYAAGVAIQTWTEVGRAAVEIDWSPTGLSAITDASLSDWGDALGEAAGQMPAKLIKIFGF